jgi:hypothetical protein
MDEWYIFNEWCGVLIFKSEIVAVFNVNLSGNSVNLQTVSLKPSRKEFLDGFK